MLYMVYADAEGYVFDWDWVKEAPHQSGHPLDPELRFGEPIPEPPKFLLDLASADFPVVTFDSSAAVRSSRGDCVFCYLTDSPSYGARINEDLTVFYSLADREKITGFKIKNVQRILQEEQELNLCDAPGLNVLILPILRKALPDHRDVTIKLYEIIITAWVDVKIPNPDKIAGESDLAPTSC